MVTWLLRTPPQVYSSGSPAGQRTGGTTLRWAGKRVRTRAAAAPARWLSAIRTLPTHHFTHCQHTIHIRCSPAIHTRCPPTHALELNPGGDQDDEGPEQGTQGRPRLAQLEDLSCREQGYSKSHKLGLPQC